MNEILNLEEACQLLNISERTIIKLLREDHLPARKIGREWRFSKQALIDWLAKGDSNAYSNQSEPIAYFEDHKLPIDESWIVLQSKIEQLKTENNLQKIISTLPMPIKLPPNVNLRVCYKQKRDLEKLEFKLYWPLDSTQI